MAHPMTAPQHPAGGLDGRARGIIVLVAAVAVGFLLLLKGGDGGSSAADKVDTGKTTIDTSGLSDESTTTTTSTSTPTSGRDASGVTVIVLNGSGKTGVAKANSDTVETGGFTMKDPDNAPAIVATTTIYYDVGYQAEGIRVAELLGKSTDSVKPLADASLGGADGGANVVVVLGTDTPAAN